MLYWPVPDSYSKEVPRKNSAGAFWEDRDDRFHCGVDIYAPEESDVIAIDSGIVLSTGVFTTAKEKPYWNETLFIVIKSYKKIIYKYAELGKILIKIGDKIEAGQLIAKVGKVLNETAIPPDAPFYIRELIYKRYCSMLHLELYKAPVSEVRPYSGGNFYGTVKPDSLIDPTYYLSGKINSEILVQQFKN